MAYEEEDTWYMRRRIHVHAKVHIYVQMHACLCVRVC